MARSRRTLRLLATVFLALVLLGMMVRTTADMLRQRREAAAAGVLVELARGIEHLSKAMQNLAFERGRTNVLLHAEPAITMDNRMFLDARRQEGMQQAARALDILAPHLPRQCQALEQQLADLDRLRATIDANLRLTRDKRPPGLAEEWFAAASGAMQGVVDMLAVTTEHAGPEDGAFSSLVRVALMSLQFRDVAGMESTVYGAALAEGGRVSAQRLRAAALRGQGDMLWLSLQREIAALGKPALLNARDTVRIHLTGGLRPVQDSILAAWDAGQAAQVQVREYTNASVAGLDALANLTAATIHAAGEHAAQRRDQAAMALTWGVAQLLLLVLAGAALPVLLRRNSAPPAAALAAPPPAEDSPELKRELEDLRAAVAEIDIGVARLDGDGRIRWYNPALAALLGHAGSLVGYRLADLLPASGRSLEHSVSGPERSFACVRDIGPLLRAEGERERLASRLWAVCTASPAGILEVNPDGDIVMANAAASRLLGRTTEQLLGNDLHVVAQHSRRDGSPCHGADCPVIQTLADGVRRSRLGETFWREDGTPVRLDVETCAVGEPGGPVDGAVVVLLPTSPERETCP